MASGVVLGGELAARLADALEGFGRGGASLSRLQASIDTLNANLARVLNGGAQAAAPSSANVQAQLTGMAATVGVPTDYENLIRVLTVTGRGRGVHLRFIPTFVPVSASQTVTNSLTIQQEIPDTVGIIMYLRAMFDPHSYDLLMTVVIDGETVIDNLPCVYDLHVPQYPYPPIGDYMAVTFVNNDLYEHTTQSHALVSLIDKTTWDTKIAPLFRSEYDATIAVRNFLLRLIQGGAAA